MVQKTKTTIQKTKMLWTAVPQHVREIVEKLAESQGVSIAEYLRKLVIEDLDKRSIFTSLLKEEIRGDG